MKIKWTSEIAQSPETTARNIAYSKSLGLPCIQEAERPPLAVVGGSPSVVNHLEELRGWKGDIWVSGSAYPWAVANGLDPVFFTIDQHPSLAKDGIGARRAVLASCCDQSVFDELKDAQITVFDLHHDGDEANHGATSVTASPKVALLMGYKEIHFFGCDSSFDKTTHAYEDRELSNRLTVACNGGEFDTEAGMVMQAEFLSVLIRQCPSVFINRSIGLLKALTECETLFDYDITHVDRNLFERMKASGQI